jgi:predicted HTH transcriptional regulator
MKLDELKDLLAESESTYMDWKKDFPQGLIHGRKDNRWDMGRGKVLKSIISLANSHDSDRAYLVYGVKDRGAEREVVGISKTFDDADFQQWTENTFDPPPTFSYSEIQWDDSTIVGVFQIERTPDYPHVVKSNLGNILFEGQVWFRRGSKNTIAFQHDLRKMIQGETPFKISTLGACRGISPHGSQ